MRKIVLTICLFFLFLCLSPKIVSQPLQIGVLYSQYTLNYHPNKKQFQAEFNTVLETLRELKTNPRIVSDLQLENGEITDCALLLLPDTRCISARQTEAVGNFTKQGGKIFALYQASYRNEKNNPATAQNNFQLNDLFGADFSRWIDHAPFCEYLGDLNWKAQKVQLGRNTAMLVKSHPQSSVIAYWYNTDFQRSEYPAIVLNKDKNCLYSGENLFLGENASSPQVKSLITFLLNLLVPNIATPPLETTPVTFHLPSIPQPSPDVIPAGHIIRIGLLENLDEIAITSTGNYKVIDKKTKKILACKNKKEITTFKKGDFVYIEPEHSFDKVIVIKINENKTYNWQVHRGQIEIFTTKRNKLTVVNVLRLNEYLAGVVPVEMPPYYHTEALKAQAIIARTFALANIGRHKKHGYDLCATVHCQAYKGLRKEVPKASQAVISTTDEVITYNDTLAYATYHSTCGGISEDVQYIWPEHKPVPYLTAVWDRKVPFKGNLSSEKDLREFLKDKEETFCQHSSRFRWQEEYTKEELEAKFRESLPVLLKKDIKLDELKDIQVTGYSPYGRVQVLEIITNSATYKIEKDNIRWLFSKGKIGLGGLQSSMFVLDRVYQQGKLVKVILTGGGWGHGVGLCQEGAQGLALKNYTYLQIIQHYYPQTLIKYR